MTRDEALARLREQVAAGKPIIGAGAGTGLSAKCAQDGGADLIIIYNSGRYRMAGRGSLAGMMPYGDANAIVMDMAREVLPVARETVPERFEGRNLYVHNPTITLMRTTREEMAELGRRIARKLNGAAGPTVLFVPLRGVSAIDVDGQPFRDAEADEALFAALREGVDRDKVELREVDADVNDPAFATAMADRLHELIAESA